jgi:hypothetical protein
MGMQFAFGSGLLIGTVLGTTAPTPRQFAILQDVTVDIDAPIKELHGQYIFPVAIARGKAKVSAKSKFASIDVAAYNDLYFGAAVATGQTNTAQNESQTVPATSAYTVTASNTAGFVDEGVFDRTLGYFLSAGTAVAANVYTVTTAGVYTFHSSAASHSLYLCYDYTIAGSGHTLTMTNQLLGVQPFFQAVLSQNFQSQQLRLALNKCVATKLGFATKLEDYNIPAFDFSAMADASGNIGTISMAN